MVSDLQDDQVEFFIPEDYFEGAATICFGSTSLAIADIPTVSGGGGSGGEEPDVPPQVPDVPALEPTGDGRIAIDGSVRDWEEAEVKSIPVQDTSGLQGVDVTEWRVAKDTEGNLYFCLEGNANAYQALAWASITLDGTTVQFNTLMKYTEGVESVYQCDANTAEAAPFVLELMLPAD